MVLHDYDQLLRELISMRKAAGWSQQRLAQELGVKQSTIGGYEAGANRVSTEVAIRWAAAFGRHLALLSSEAGARHELASAAATLPAGELDDLLAVVRRLTDPSVPAEVRAIGLSVLRGLGARKAG